MSPLYRSLLIKGRAEPAEYLEHYWMIVLQACDGDIVTLTG